MIPAVYVWRHVAATSSASERIVDISAVMVTVSTCTTDESNCQPGASSANIEIARRTDATTEMQSCQKDSRSRENAGSSPVDLLAHAGVDDATHGRGLNDCRQRAGLVLMMPIS